MKLEIVPGSKNERMWQLQCILCDVQCTLYYTYTRHDESPHVSWERKSNHLQWYTIERNVLKEAAWYNDYNTIVFDIIQYNSVQYNTVYVLQHGYRAAQDSTI